MISGTRYRLDQEVNRQLSLSREIAKAQDYSEDTALRIDHEVKRFVMENYARAREILTEQKTALLNIAEQLLAREVLDADQVKRLAKGLPLEDATAPSAVSPAGEPRREPADRPAIVPALNKPVGQE